MSGSHLDGQGLWPDVPSLMPTPTPSLPDAIMEDTLLLRRVAARDTEAFDHLYRKYRPRLTRFLAQHLHESSTIDEVCNDVMLVVWKKAAQFQPTSKVSTWIFGIARLQARRARTRTRSGLDNPTPPDHQECDENTPEMTLVVREQGATLAQAVAALPLTLQTSVVLAYYHECSTAHIAAQMHCSPSTVKVRLHQARRRLRATLTRADRRRSPDGVREAAAPVWRDVTQITSAR